MADKPWDGRFSERTDRSTEDFTASIHVDRRLYAYDIEGSVAHCRMLARTGIITEEEASDLIEGLGRIKREIEHGDFEFDPGLEDIHMHIETRLVQEVGKAAQKLHTARSRNDQVAVDTRLYLREEIHHIISDLAGLRRVLVDLAKNHVDTVLPGYTHLQRAQPVLLAHHFMAYYEMLTRDGERFRDAWRRGDVMPLGSAALAGTPYPIDRDYTAELLGFSKVSANSLDAVGDRDFAIEVVSAAAICMMHLSRLSEELILWSSAEFGFIELPDAFATGSSIMPQKKNPDVPELVRGKTGRVYGDLIALLSMMKALPLAYNRDMQEDKEPLFDALDTLKNCIRIYAKMLPRVTVNTAKMMAAGSSGYLNATDLADYLVTQGMAFREAHNCVGRAVGHAFSQGKELYEMDLEELRSFSNLIKEDVYEALQTRNTIDRRTSAGGTATANVRKSIEAAEKILDVEAQT